MRSSSLVARTTLAAAALTLGVGGCATDSTGEQVGNVSAAQCPGGVIAAPALWTVMHYAAADNNLEDVLLEDIDEMVAGHSGTTSVNVIVQLDKELEDGLWRYRIGRDGSGEVTKQELSFSEDEPDSGDWKTLEQFGQWAATCYPAENYVVIIGGHGGGWSTSGEARNAGTGIGLKDRVRGKKARYAAGKRGRGGEALRIIAPDDSSNNEITVDQLAVALKTIREATKRPTDHRSINRLIAYGSDACLMGSIEVAYELRNTARYSIGSEESEPGQGWPYNTIVRTLTERPVQYYNKPDDLAAAIVDRYAASYGPGGSADPDERITLSATYHGGFASLRPTMKTISTLLAQLLDGEQGGELKSALYDARDEAYRFGDDYVDMGMLFTALRRELLERGLIPELGSSWAGAPEWKQLREKLDHLMSTSYPKSITAATGGQGFSSATGLTIYFPVDDCGYGPPIAEYQTSAWSQATGWANVIERFAGGGAEPEEAFGYGNMTYMLMDVKVGDAEPEDAEIEAWTDCEIRNGYMSVYTYEMDNCSSDNEDICMSDLSFDIDLDAKKITNAYMWLEWAQADAELQEADVSIEVSDWDDFAYYEGEATLKLPYQDEESASSQEVKVNVSFYCEIEETQGCDDYY